MNKSLIFTFWAALITVACSSTPKSYIIEGVVPDASYNHQTVYLYEHETRNLLDSALITNGKFTFTGSIDTAILARVELNKRLFTIIVLENGNISVDLSVSESAKGTPLNDELSKYLIERTSHGLAFSTKQAELRKMPNADKDAQQKNLEEYTRKTDSLCAKFFHANQNNILGALALWNWSYFITPDQLDALYEQSSDIFCKFKPLKKIMDARAIVKRTSEGMPFTDFTIENGNLDGSRASLSDYVGKGKYVLVDFWASWCAPCIAEIPNIKEVYQKYNGNRFTVLGVAVWDKREESLKSIEKHKMPWNQIFDDSRISTDLYGIKGIPTIILFDPDGMIVARNLHGEELKTKVMEVMNK